MKVRTAVRRLCDACRVVLRRGRVYVVCKANPKVRESVCVCVCDLCACATCWGRRAGERGARAAGAAAPPDLPIGSRGREKKSQFPPSPPSLPTQHKQRQGLHTAACDLALVRCAFFFCFFGGGTEIGRTRHPRSHLHPPPPHSSPPTLPPTFHPHSAVLGLRYWKQPAA